LLKSYKNETKISLILGYLNRALNNPALDIRIGLLYTHLLREIIYEIDPGKEKGAMLPIAECL